MDFHDVHVTQQSLASSSIQPTAHHSDRDGREGSTILGSLQFRRLLLAAALPGGELTKCFLDLCSSLTEI